MGHVVCFEEFVDNAGAERIPCPTIWEKQFSDEGQDPRQASVDGVLRTAVI